MNILAYGVHLLTAVGAALGLWAIILIYDGYFQWALWILALSVLIDAVDGTLARATNIKTEAPKIDGALMDNIIDFIIWTIAPLLWAYAALQIPPWILLACALSSILGFSNTRAKTSDNFFLGFPSYWNIVVFYLFLLDLPTAFSSGILLLFAAGTFMPVKFIYPTKTARFKKWNIMLGGLFFIQMLLLLYFFDDSSPFLIYSSFLYPVYYFGLSFYLNLEKN
ncbi:CDP-alcohol phosphatidyltransferase family protein [Halalkalibaculum sp. DA3122]|uniref:CDP-alcohol phosphatidyltransferase family protein n=1 Tax=unclassified Halalkalibaculum TaxID=2964617 RepID=UPI003754B3C4